MIVLVLVLENNISDSSIQKRMPENVIQVWTGHRYLENLCVYERSDSKQYQAVSNLSSNSSNTLHTLESE